MKLRAQLNIHQTNRYMKNVLTLALVLVFLFNCQSPDSGPKFTASQFESIGKIHNKGLDFVLSTLKEEKNAIALTGASNGKRTLSQLLQENQEAAIRYIAQEGADLSSKEMQFAIEKSNSITKTYTEYLLKKKADLGRTGEGIEGMTDAIMADVIPYISSEQHEMFNDIFSALNNNDINSVQNNLNTIESEVINLPASEQPIMFEAISVARSSSQYWNQNYPVWQEVSIR